MERPDHIPEELISESKKKYPESISWIATVNNPGSGLEDYESAAKAAGATAFRAQLEKGESGTVHVQAAVQFGKKVRSSVLRRIFGQHHWHSPSANFAAAWKYCGKEDTRVEGPIEFGAPKVKKEQGQDAIKQRNLAIVKMGAAKAVEEGLISLANFVRIDQAVKLYQAQTADIADIPKLDNYWIVGAPGTGKSRAARNRWPDLFNKPCNKWWDGYTGQDTVLIDDVEPCHSVLGHHLKIWGDHYGFQGEVKGGTQALRPQRLVVTSNYMPGTIWQDPEMIEAIRRRFKVWIVSEDKWEYEQGTGTGRPTKQ